MLFRSPRRFAILTFVSFVFIVAVLQQSPWVNQKVYARISLFSSGTSKPNQEPIHSQDTDQSLPQRLGDFWHQPPPTATPTAIDVELVAGGTGSNPVIVPVADSKPNPPWVTAPSRTASFVPPTPRPTNVKDYIIKMLQWSRPSWNGHWPPFEDYVDKEYDPNRWEQFDM